MRTLSPPHHKTGIATSAATGTSHFRSVAAPMTTMVAAMGSRKPSAIGIYPIAVAFGADLAGQQIEPAAP